MQVQERAAMIPSVQAVSLDTVQFTVRVILPQAEILPFRTGIGAMVRCGRRTVALQNTNTK